MKFTCAHDRLQFRNRRSNIVIRIFAIHLLFLIAIAPFSRAGTPTPVYVDPAGNDNGGNCGSTKAKACASLAQAQLLVRNNPGSTVLVDGGYYYLPSSPTNPGTLSFGTADSGASGAVTTWEANPGTGTPVTP